MAGEPETAPLAERLGGAGVLGGEAGRSLRGPQFEFAWCDELAKWTEPEQAWDMLQFGLRLGRSAPAVVTTTPRPNMTLKEIIEDAATVVTSAPTDANRMHLARSFLQTVARKYAGTSMGRQELDGEMLMDAEGALWTWATLDAVRRPRSVEPDRIVVAVDPPVTSGTSSDECGIIVAGAARQGPPQDWNALVIEDASVHGASPQVWAERAVAAFHRHKADRVVAEVNQGGDLVVSVRAQASIPTSPCAPCGRRAASGCALSRSRRSMPRAAWRMSAFPMRWRSRCACSAPTGLPKAVPTGVDALVWALTDLIVDAAAAAVQQLKFARLARLTSSGLSRDPVDVGSAGGIC